MMQVYTKTFAKKVTLLFIWSFIVSSLLTAPLLAKKPEGVFRLTNFDGHRIEDLVEERSLKSFDEYWSWIKNKDPKYLQLYIDALFSDSARAEWKEGVAFSLNKGVRDVVVRSVLESAFMGSEWKRFELIKSSLKDPKRVQTALAWILYKRAQSSWRMETIDKIIELGANPNFVLTPEIEYSQNTWGQREYEPYTGCGPILHRTLPNSKQREMLLKAGADPKLLDCEGRTLIEADAERDSELEKLILEEEDAKLNKGANGYRDWE